MSNGDFNAREEVPFPASGPVNVEDAYADLADQYPAPQIPIQSYVAGPNAAYGPPPGTVPMRLQQRPQITAPVRSAITSPDEVLAVLRRLNPEKVRLASVVFGRSAGTSEGNLLQILAKVDPPVLVGVLGLAQDVMGALVPSPDRPVSDILVNLEVLGSVLVLMSRPQQHAQALQALGALLA